MQLKTILNRVQRYKSFVYTDVRFTPVGGEEVLEVEVQPRANGRPVCSGCGQVRSGYDRRPARRFEFVPLWGIRVYLVYAPRRVACPECGVKIERMPWAVGKRPLTEAYAWFLATWAKRMSWSEVAVAFRASWETVFRSVEMAVRWGREHMSLEGVTAIGVDELLWHRGHQYLTLVYQINAECKRLLWVAEGRTVRSLLGFFRWLGTERSRLIKFICSDMWKPYLKVIAKKAGQAVHILDRFHIMQHFSKASASAKPWARSKVPWIRAL
jgi:transposase